MSTIYSIFLDTLRFIYNIIYHLYCYSLKLKITYKNIFDNIDQTNCKLQITDYII